MKPLVVYPISYFNLSLVVLRLKKGLVNRNCEKGEFFWGWIVKMCHQKRNEHLSGGDDCSSKARKWQMVTCYGNAYYKYRVFP